MQNIKASHCANVSMHETYLWLQRERWRSDVSDSKDSLDFRAKPEVGVLQEGYVICSALITYYQNGDVKTHYSIFAYSDSSLEVAGRDARKSVSEGGNVSALKKKKKVNSI